MATARIPPVGSICEAIQRQEKLKRECTSPDPVERYRLRNERMQTASKEYFTELVREARKNHTTAEELRRQL